MTDNHEASHHIIVPAATYIRTIFALLFLTFLTVFIAQLDFGSLNIVLAMVIALVKASFVVSIFMGLKWDHGFNRIILISSVAIFVIFAVFSVLDLGTRGDIEPKEAGVYNIDSPVRLIEKNTTHSSDSSKKGHH